MTRTQVVLPRDNPFEILLDRFTMALPNKKTQRGGEGARARFFFSNAWILKSIMLVFFLVLGLTREVFSRTSGLMGVHHFFQNCLGYCCWDRMLLEESQPGQASQPGQQGQPARPPSQPGESANPGHPDEDSQPARPARQASQQASQPD